MKTHSEVGTFAGRGRGGWRVAGLVGLLVASVFVAPATTALGRVVNNRINSNQAQGDGCKRTTLGLLDPRNAQSWVYVGRNNGWVQASGPIAKVKVSDEDLWTQHEDNQEIWGGSSYFIHHDVNVDVAVTDQRLLSTGDPDNLLHVEATSGEWTFYDSQGQPKSWYEPFNRTLGGDHFPAVAWGMPGDFALGRGPLIWDCGHWDNGGEDTEMHGFRWWQASHNLPGGLAFDPRQPSFVTPAAEHTIYGNSNRQAAGLVEEYALSCQSGTCNPNPPSARQDPLVLNGQETFFLKAPPKPTPTAKPVWQEARFSVPQMNNVGTTSVTPAPDGSGVSVTIDMRGQGGPQRDTGYAARWYIGWDAKSPGAGFVKMKTEFLKYWCLEDFDAFGAGEFQLQFGAGNDWSYKWDAGLNSCSKGSPQVVLNPTPTFTAMIPDNQLLPVRLRGYENDDPLPGIAIPNYDATWPLQNQTQTVTDPQGNYKVEVQTTVLGRY